MQEISCNLKTAGGRSFAKVIKMVKSPKTGAYVFKKKWYLVIKCRNFCKIISRLINHYTVKSSFTTMRGFLSEYGKMLNFVILEWSVFCHQIMNYK